MEEIIKKAIGGGYDEGNIMVNGNILNENPFSSRGVRNPANVVCDPLFWQALGKACGWREHKVHLHGGVEQQLHAYEKFTWLKFALHFHEINLTEGRDKAVDYLLSTIKREEK